MLVYKKNTKDPRTISDSNSIPLGQVTFAMADAVEQLDLLWHELPKSVRQTKPVRCIYTRHSLWCAKQNKNTKKRRLCKPSMLLCVYSLWSVGVVIWSRDVTFRQNQNMTIRPDMWCPHFFYWSKKKNLAAKGTNHEGGFSVPTSRPTLTKSTMALNDATYSRSKELRQPNAILGCVTRLLWAQPLVCVNIEHVDPARDKLRQVLVGAGDGHIRGTCCHRLQPRRPTKKAEHWRVSTARIQF